MLLRTKIFRYLVVFALVPSLFLSIVAAFMIVRTVDKTGSWLASSSPDRTINSLRLLEDYLQQSSRKLLRSIDRDSIAGGIEPLNWIAAAGSDSSHSMLIITDQAIDRQSLLTALPEEPGPIRRVVDAHLILGWAEISETGVMAGGFILDREYLSGFEAVSQSLSESRGYKNILPAFVIFVIVAGMAVLLMVIVSAYLLSRRLSSSITTPLERLSVFTMAVARGQKPERLALAGTEEVQNLSENFNRMTTDLEISRRRLMAAERVAAWQGFARRLAHELKNPLTPISISLFRIKNKLIESGQFDPYADSIEAISAEVEHLQRLAADYSSLAKLPEPKFRAFDFGRLVGEVVELFLAQLDDYQFENHWPGETGSVNGDPDRLREVMVNLFKNAIAFAPAGGKIVLEGGREDGRLIFSLANENGTENNIEANLRSAKLPYFSTREGGSGLGLAVSEKIIIDHGGALTLTLKGAMTEARFEIPADKIQLDDRS